MNTVCGNIWCCSPNKIRKNSRIHVIWKNSVYVGWETLGWMFKWRWGQKGGWIGAVHDLTKIKIISKSYETPLACKLVKNII